MTHCFTDRTMQLVAMAIITVLMLGCNSVSSNQSDPETDTTASGATVQRIPIEEPGVEANARPDTFDLTKVPIVPAPDGLAATTLPTEPAAITMLFVRLPAAIGNLTRAASSQSSEMLVRYRTDVQARGEAISIGVSDMRMSDFYPSNWSAAERIAFELATTTAVGGRDGHLYWAITSTDSGDQQQYTLLAGTLDSPWLFVITADTLERVSAAVVAVMEATR